MLFSVLLIQAIMWILHNLLISYAIHSFQGIGNWFTSQTDGRIFQTKSTESTETIQIGTATTG